MMAVDRRQFLKVAGISTLLGIGGKTAFEILSPGQLEASSQKIPLTAGKRWAMVVDTHKMDEGLIEKCVEACHREHNVPNLNSQKEEVKWLWKEDYHHTFPNQQHRFTKHDVIHKILPVMCNHCSNPPCCRVCPTQSTWQRDDGIVMMDPHRCIGCRFCMAACPFGARSFNWGDPRRVMTDDSLKELNPDFPQNLEYPTRCKGVVEKCNFCAERLAKGLSPKCVEVANDKKEAAMIFGDLADPESEIRTILNERYSIRRKPELGTEPNLYFLI